MFCRRHMHSSECCHYFLCIYWVEGKTGGWGGGGLMHAYVWEHIFSFYYWTTWWMFMKLGRDEVLKVPHIYFGISARSTQGWIQGGAKIGHVGSPSSKNFFSRPEGYSNKPNAQQWSKSMWEQVLMCMAPFGSQIFDDFLCLFGLSHFGVF